MAHFRYYITIVFLFFCTHLIAQNRNETIEWAPELTNVWEPVPEVITPGDYTEAPSDAIILFNGEDLDQWERFSGTFLEDLKDPQRQVQPAGWEIKNDHMTVIPGNGDIMTRRKFGDIQLHLEWRTPAEIKGEDQGRGNSGVFLQGLYEVQILDSYNNSTYPNGQAGSVYKQHIPLVNASRPPGEWQTYDIFFEAPVFREDGRLVKPAYMTVIHNGVLIQHHVEIKGGTVYRGLPEYEKHPEKLPLRLQNHGDRVSFRNIWVRELTMY